MAAVAPFTGSLRWVIRNQPTERRACYCLLCRVLGSRGKGPRRDRILESSPCCLPAHAARGGKQGKSCTASPPPLPLAWGGTGGACGLLPCRGAACTGSTWASACPAPPFQHPMLIWVSHSCTGRSVLGPSLSFEPLTLRVGASHAGLGCIPLFLAPSPCALQLAGSPFPLLHSPAPLIRLVGTVPCSVYLQLWFWWEPVCSCSTVIYEAVLTNASQVPGGDVS